MFSFHLFNYTEAMNLSRKGPIKEFFPVCENESKEECQLSQLCIEWKIRKNVRQLSLSMEQTGRL